MCCKPQLLTNLSYILQKKDCQNTKSSLTDFCLCSVLRTHAVMNIFVQQYFLWSFRAGKPTEMFSCLTV